MRCISVVLYGSLIMAAVLASPPSPPWKPTSPPKPPSPPPKATPAPTPKPTPAPAANCLYASSSSGIYCNSQQTCCGYNTITPSCLDNGSDKQCCVHYKSATQCNSTQTCCGALGPGASSSAFCCDEGSTCCQATVSYSGSASCCAAGSQCCQGSGLGFCCPSNTVCNSLSYTCDPPATPVPNTPAQATPQPPAPQPTAAPPASSHHLCLHYSYAGVGTFYDVVADGSQTVLTRYNMMTNPPTLIDVHVYAALAMPNPPGSAFDVGVAFAASMQTLNAWMYPATSQTSAAYWDVLGADGDRWRFQTTQNGSPLEVTFATQNCESF